MTDIRAGTVHPYENRRLLPPLGEEISDYQARLQLARLLSEDADRVDAAIAHYRQLILRNPTDAAVVLELAELLVRVGKFGEAIPSLKTLMASTPKLRIPAAVSLARAFSGRGDDAAAIDLLEPLYRLHPRRYDVGIELAAAYARTGEPQRASTLLSGITSAFPSDAKVHLAAARLESDLGHAAAASRYFKNAVALAEDPVRIRLEYAAHLPMWGDFYRSDAIYREMQAARPGDADVQRKRAETLTGAQRYAEAEGIYRRLLLDEDLPKQLLWLDVARTRFEAKDDQRAMTAIDRILDPLDKESVGDAPSCTVQPIRKGLYLTVSFSRPIGRVTTFTLADPVRLVLDLHGIPPTRTETVCRVGFAGVARVRSGEHPDRTRLVIDAADPNFAPPLVVYGERSVHLVFSDEAGGGEDRRKGPDRRLLSSALTGAFTLKAELLQRSGRLSEAIRLQRFRCWIPGEKTAAQLELGRLYRKRGEDGEAGQWFAKAIASDPDSIPALFYSAGPETALSKIYIRDITSNPEISPMRLVAWGQLYAQQGWYEPALIFYTRAADVDPECFPARLALAETLAYDRRFEEAHAAFTSLSSNYPGNRKVWVARARALSWDKRYEEALEVYETIQKHDLSDPLPRLESARTAAWAKQMGRARDLYAVLWQPTVDRQLAEGLGAISGTDEGDPLHSTLEQTRSLAGEDHIFSAYESFLSDLSRSEVATDAEADLRSLRLLAAELWSKYRIQKEAFLEYQAKQLAWDRRFPSALDRYNELLATRPGNQEALFDQAQVACSLGLCSQEEQTYRGLLQLEPNHTLAQRALHRLEIRGLPSLALGGEWWEEEGVDRLSDVRRFRTNAALEIPVSCRYRLQIEGHRWEEEPGPEDTVYRAVGYTLGAAAVFSPHWTGSARWTHKDYTQGDAKNTDTGAVQIGYRMDSGGIFRAGFERVDELANSYAFRQGIQSSDLWGSLYIPIRRKWELEGELRFKRFTDDNQGWSLMVSGGHALTDHPRMFKVLLSGQYRDTREQSQFLLEDGVIVDVVHPYWTPDDYLSGTLTLEWYHDLARDFFCGARRHYYDLKLSLGLESEDNALLRLEGEWRYDFADRWSVALNGLLHESSQWDAYGLWASLQYRYGEP
ncbi:MAG: tetratricopeptide repeat protein [Desulfobacteraceae bacterium]|nr:tetratricopeptide repeat protein [Desulfobacteraceae bacterium]